MRGRVAIRWTIGDVSRAGFEALRLSTWGAYRIFGPHAAYAVCVNTLSAGETRSRAGELPGPVEWVEVSLPDVPAFLARRLDERTTEGAAWEFAPLRLFPDHLEIALDNDCILWSLPPALAGWLEAGDHRTCVMTEDVRRCLGRFADLCPTPIHSGLRALPPGFDLESALRRVLDEREALLTAELDEQGLQAAALSLERPLVTVPARDVAVVSPFPPHGQQLGRHGAHFVGVNARARSFEVEDRNAAVLTQERWASLRGEVAARVRLPEHGVPGEASPG